MKTTIIESWIFIVLYLIYAMIEAWEEAGYYHYRVKSGGTFYDKYEHTWFTLKRSIMAFFMVLAIGDKIIGFETLISLIMMFSFVHNGFYFYSRNQLNPEIYKKGWKDDSLTSTAKIELNYQVRLVLFWLGLMNQLLITIYYLWVK